MANYQNLLPNVEAFDSQTNSIRTFELPTARQSIYSTTVGSSVVFVGGVNNAGMIMQQDYVNKIDIYDTTVDGIWTIDLPDVNVNSRPPVVVGTKLYFYPRNSRNITIVDIATNITSQEQLLFSGNPEAATTNGSHIFFAGFGLTSVYAYEVSTNIWTDLQLNLPTMTATLPQLFTMIGSHTLVIIRARTLAQVDTRYQPMTVTLTALNGIVSSLNVVGGRLYLFHPNAISVYSPGSGIIEYKFGTRFGPGVSVIYNNTVYFSLQDGNNNAVNRFNLDYLFKPAPVPWNNLNDIFVADRGYVFVIGIREISFVNLRTQQTGAIQHDEIFPYIHTRSAAMGNKFIITLERVYGLFNFDTETMTIHPMPNQLQYRLPIVSGRRVLFAERFFPTSYLFDSETNQWSEVQLDGGIYYIMQDKIVVTDLTSIRIYDIPSQQWAILFEDSWISASLIHGESLVFQARSTVHLYNLNTGETTSVQSPEATYAFYETILAVGDYAIFVRRGTRRFHILNVKSLTWTTIDLPTIPTTSSNTAMIVRGHENVVYIARVGRIDTIDLSTMTLTSINGIPMEQPEIIDAFGSKVTFLSSTSNSGNLIAVFEISTRTWTSVLTTYRYQRRVLLMQNYIVSNVDDIIQWMEFPVMLNTINDEERFIGQSVDFTVNAIGSGISPTWTFGSSTLQNFSLSLHNLTEQDSGRYTIRITDRCQNAMSQTSTLQVHGVPSFARQLTESIILCDESSRIQANVSGKAMQVRWEIDNQLLDTTDRDYINVSKGKLALACNSQHQLCAVASNPSGQVRCCATVQLRSIDSIFDGPRPASAQLTYFTDSVVDLVVNLLHEDCTEHLWLLNGREIGEAQPRNSVLSVTISQLVTANEYKVRAICGNSILESNVFAFDASRVSSFTPEGVAFFVVGAFALLVGAIVTGILVQRRLKRSKQHEIELENLLNQAKSESYKPKDGVSIIHTTTWEWSPGDSYTYRPIDDFPCEIDTSLLKYSFKNAVDVDVWIQGDIVFSPKEKGNAKDKRERLLNGLQMDVYVPQSPKYEIKVEPASFTLQGNKQIRVTVSSIVRMTTKTKICLIIVSEQQMIYSVVEFKIESKPSMWIDIEEIKMTGDFLGGGGYVNDTCQKHRLTHFIRRFGAVTRGVYRGQDVAVKKLLLQHMVDDILKEFEHEISLMKSLHHPNIVQFVGASNVHENLAIIIEFAPLGSLASVMKKHNLSWSMKITALFEIAKALQFLHANGIIHRDIKPQNILVFSLEQRTPVHVKLTDFGTARFITENATNVTRNVGTVVYMAPESLGKNPRIDKSADVYSFAVLMWEVLYEQSPYEEFQWQSDLEKHVLQGKRMRLDPLPNDQLVKLIEESWHPDPSQRPSMTAVAQRLADLTV
jgi:serine/threonine protein kinase